VRQAGKTLTVRLACIDAPERPYLSGCIAKDTAISMETGRETPEQPCCDSRLLQHREAALMVDTGASGGKALTTDVLD
jgi:hypothetical protein